MYTRWVFFPFPSASFILSPGLQIPDMSAQRQETETKSSWAKRGPDNKTIFYLLAFLLFCRLCIQYRITHTHTHRGREKEVCLFFLSLVCRGKEATQRPRQRRAKLKTKSTELYIYTLTDYFNPFFLVLYLTDQVLSAHVHCVWMPKRKKKVRQGPLLRPLTFQLCAADSPWTQGQGQGGWKSLRINAWQRKCSCSWKSVGLGGHIPEWWHTYTHCCILLRLHGPTSAADSQSDGVQPPSAASQHGNRS